MFGFHAADSIVLVVYFVIIIFIGIRAIRTIRNISEFLMPRRFGQTLMVIFTFGTGTNADQAVSVTSARWYRCSAMECVISRQQS